LLAGCSSYQSATKPRLIANGKTRHSWIENRRPPRYGDGLEGGCLALGEFEVHLLIYRDSTNGIIKDVNSKKPVSYVSTPFFRQY
jgi:hypothetical protein